MTLPHGRPRARGAHRSLHAASSRDRGSAVVEFCVLTVVLLVPLIYAAAAVGKALDARAAAAAAVKEAGRAYVTAQNPASASVRASTAARLMLSDRGVGLPAGALRLSCSGRCLSPGTTVRTTLTMRVNLPAVPGLGALSIPVSASAVTPVDRFRGDPT